MKLKFPTKNDIGDFLTWWSDREICHLNFHSEPPKNLTYEDVKERLFKNKEGRKYIIIEKNNENIGYITGRIVNDKNLDVGMMIYNKKHRNKGTAQKIFKIVTSFVKNFNKLEACTITDNAKYLLNKLGFVKTKENNFELNIKNEY